MCPQTKLSHHIHTIIPHSNHHTIIILKSINLETYIYIRRFTYTYSPIDYVSILLLALRYDKFYACCYSNPGGACPGGIYAFGSNPKSSSSDPTVKSHSSALPLSNNSTVFFMASSNSSGEKNMFNCLSNCFASHSPMPNTFPNTCLSLFAETSPLCWIGLT